MDITFTKTNGNLFTGNIYVGAVNMATQQIRNRNLAHMAICNLSGECSRL